MHSSSFAGVPESSFWMWKAPSYIGHAPITHRVQQGQSKPMLSSVFTAKDRGCYESHFLVKQTEAFKDFPLDRGRTTSYRRDRVGDQYCWTANLQLSTAPEHFWRDQKLFLALNVSLLFCMILVPKLEVQERFRRAKNATVKRGELPTSIPARAARAAEIPKGLSYRVCWEIDLKFNLKVSPT